MRGGDGNDELFGWMGTDTLLRRRRHRQTVRVERRRPAVRRLRLGPVLLRPGIRRRHDPRLRPGRHQGRRASRFTCAWESASNLATYTSEADGSDLVITVKFNNVETGTITLKGISADNDDLNVVKSAISSENCAGLLKLDPYPETIWSATLTPQFLVALFMQLWLHRDRARTRLRSVAVALDDDSFIYEGGFKYRVVQFGTSTDMITGRDCTPLRVQDRTGTNFRYSRGIDSACRRPGVRLRRTQTFTGFRGSRAQWTFTEDQNFKNVDRPGFGEPYGRRWSTHSVKAMRIGGKGPAFRPPRRTLHATQDAATA